MEQNSGQVKGEMSQAEIDRELERQFPLMFFEMLDPQERFIRVKNSKGRTPRRRIFEAGNKCITADTLVETTAGNIPVGELYKAGKPFEVYAFDGFDKVVARATAPFKKPDPEYCYRISFSDGKDVGVSASHLVLTDRGYFAVQLLYESAHALSPSSSERALSVHPSGVVRWFETRSSCPGRYSAGSRQYDARPRGGSEGDLVSAPLQGDAAPHNDQRPYLDVRDCIRRCSLYVKSYLLSIQDALLQGVAPFVGYSDLAYDTTSQSLLYGHQLSPQPSTAGAGQLQSVCESCQYLRQSDSAASSYQPPDDGNNRVSITPITGLQEVYDFTVEKYHNYFAGGLIHHNCGKTEIGVAEDIAHMMGFRPWLDEDDPDYKIDIQVPNIGLVIGETMIHSIGEKIEPTFRRLIPKTCVPVFKAGPTGTSISVTLTYDWKGKKCGSKAYFRSNDQRADTFEGIDFHWIHGDEPPDEKVLTAAERGKVVSNAPSWFTMTPLKNPYFFDRYSSRAAIRI